MLEVEFMCPSRVAMLARVVHGNLFQEGVRLLSMNNMACEKISQQLTACSAVQQGCRGACQSFLGPIVRIFRRMVCSTTRAAFLLFWLENEAALFFHSVSTCSPLLGFAIFL